MQVTHNRIAINIRRKLSEIITMNFIERAIQDIHIIFFLKSYLFLASYCLEITISEVHWHSCIKYWLSFNIYAPKKVGQFSKVIICADIQSMMEIYGWRRSPCVVCSVHKASMYINYYLSVKNIFVKFALIWIKSFVCLWNSWKKETDFPSIGKSNTHQIGELAFCNNKISKFPIIKN